MYRLVFMSQSQKSVSDPALPDYHKIHKYYPISAQFKSGRDGDRGAGYPASYAPPFTKHGGGAECELVVAYGDEWWCLFAK